MGLKAQAVADAKAILEDSASGFGVPLALTSPAGDVLDVVGFATDVSEQVDPETQVVVASRQASVSISLGSLPVLPVAVSSKNQRPWLVAFADSAGVVGTWKVVEVLPDRALGVVVLRVEAYRAGAD
jgi:hypothetical protein